MEYSLALQFQTFQYSTQVPPPVNIVASKRNIKTLEYPMKHLCCMIGKFPLNYQHHCKVVGAASLDSWKVSETDFPYISMNDILLHVKIKYEIYLWSIFTASFIILVKLYFPYLNIPTLTRSWSERSACAALGCWPKRRWPLF